MDMTDAVASPAQVLATGLGALGAVAYGKDASGRYVWVNAAAEAVFEREAAQIVGRTDAERNCVSNIRPAGLPPAQAAEVIARLLQASRRQQVSGIRLREETLPFPH